jgi:hypothetical protein
MFWIFKYLFSFLVPHFKFKTEKLKITSPIPIPKPIPKPLYVDKYKLQLKNMTGTIGCDELNIPPHYQTNYVMEYTPIGNNIIMMFDFANNVFQYYSDSTVSYSILEVVARKYVIRFKCPNIYVDMNTESNRESNIATTKVKTVAAIVQPTFKKGGFAKLKTRVNSHISSTKVGKVKINKFKCVGKFADFNILRPYTTNQNNNLNMQEEEEEESANLEIANISWTNPTNQMRKKMTFAEFQHANYKKVDTTSTTPI